MHVSNELWPRAGDEMPVWCGGDAVDGGCGGVAEVEVSVVDLDAVDADAELEVWGGEHLWEGELVVGECARLDVQAADHAACRVGDEDGAGDGGDAVGELGLLAEVTEPGDLDVMFTGGEGECPGAEAADGGILRGRGGEVAAGDDEDLGVVVGVELGDAAEGLDLRDGSEAVEGAVLGRGRAGDGVDVRVADDEGAEQVAVGTDGDVLEEGWGRELAEDGGGEGVWGREGEGWESRG